MSGFEFRPEAEDITTESLLEAIASVRELVAQRIAELHLKAPQGKTFVITSGDGTPVNTELTPGKKYLVDEIEEPVFKAEKIRVWRAAEFTHLMYGYSEDDQSYSPDGCMLTATHDLRDGFSQQQVIAPLDKYQIALDVG